MKTIRNILANLLLLLATAVAVSGQSVLLDFNTPGQLTNLFGTRSQAQSANAAVWVEVPTNGVANGGSIDNGRATTDNTTLTYLGEGFAFPTNNGAQLRMSLLFKGKTPVANADPMINIGFISGTNGSTEGSTPLNWMNLRLVTGPNITNMGLHHGLYVTTNLGAAYVYSTNTYSLSNLLMTGGAAGFTNWYQLSASFTRTNITNILVTGTLSDMGALGSAAPGSVMLLLTNSVVVNALPFGTTFYPCVRANDNNGVDRMDNFAAWMTNGPAVVAPLAAQSVTATRPVTFKALADGTPPVFYTWYTNGVALAGAAGYSLTLQPAASMTVAVAVTNSLGGSVSAPATLTVSPDTAAPALVSAGSLDGAAFGLAFDELLDPATAVVAANYSVNGAAAASAALLPDGKRVKITLAAPVTGAFTVAVSGVADLTGNAAAGASASGRVMGLATGDIGSPATAGSSLSFNTGDMDVLAAGGWDFWGIADQGTAALGVRTGDFDVSVRVASITRVRGMSTVTGRDEFAEAGLVARESWLAASRGAFVMARPSDSGMPVGPNIVYAGQRSSYQGGAGAVGGNQAQLIQGGYYSNVWVRLRRVNNTLTTYWWTNSNPSTNWVQIGQVTYNPPLPDSLFVGPAACAHFDGMNYPVSAQFKSYGDFSYPGAAISVEKDLPTVVTSTPNATVALALNAVCSVVPAAEVQYLWQRGDGAGGFTNIPFVASGAGLGYTYTSPTLFLADSGSQFRAVIKAPGATPVTSSVTTVLVVDTNPPAVVSVVVPAVGSNALTATFFMNLDPASAGDLANYTVQNSLGQAYVISSVLVESTTATNLTKVTIFTTQPLTNGADYMVTVSNVRGTNSVAILPTTARAAMGNVKVEIWNNITAGSITNLISTNKFQANLPDYVFYTNVFGYNYPLTGGFVTSPLGDNYGGRVSGCFLPPSNGVYRFYIRSDDASRLYMNTNGPDPAGKSLLCDLVVNVGTYMTAAYPSNLSAAVSLQAGVPYYIEGIWKEGTGGDGFAMAFREAGETTPPANQEVADGRFFVPLPFNQPSPSAILGGGQFWPLNPAATLGFLFPSNSVTIQIYTNIAGTNISDLTASAKYLANLPDITLITNAFGFSTNLAASPLGGSYGARMSAWFRPPTNGLYRFYVKADDGGQLWMNTNGSDPAGRVLIAYTNQYTANGYASNGLSVSAPVTMVAGNLYYMEGLWKQGTGGDGFAVTVRGFSTAALATGSTTVPVAGEVASGTLFQPVMNTLATWQYAFSNALPFMSFPVRADLYAGVSDLASLAASAKFQANTPDGVIYTNAFGYDTNLTGTAWPGTAYSARLAAYFSAPTTGVYRFYIKADDSAQLWMNTNFASGFDPAGRVKIAWTDSPTPNRYTNDGTVVSAPIWLTNGQYYYTEALFSQGGGGGGFAMTFRVFPDVASASYAALAIPPAYEAASGLFFRPVVPFYPSTVPAVAAAQQPMAPGLVAEIYTGISTGGGIPDLMNGPKFRAGAPDYFFPMTYLGWNRDLFTSAFPGDNYGVHMAALFVPPTNGLYRVWARSDDNIQVFINPNGPDAAGKVQAIAIANATYQGGNSYTLTAGRQYFFEVFFKEGGGGDGWAVTFTGGSTPAATDVASSSHFLPLGGAVSVGALVQAPSGTIFTENASLTFFATNIAGATPMAWQWKRNGVPIPGATSWTYTRVLTPADSVPAVYSLVAYNPYGQVEKSINVNLNVAADSGVPVVTSVVGNGLNSEVLVTFSKSVTPATATNIANYSIPGLTVTGAWAKSATVVSLLTSPQTPGQRYYLTVTGVRDTTYSANLILPSTIPFSAWNLARGLVTIHRYDGNVGSQVQNLQLFSEPRFINNAPDVTAYSASFSYSMSGGTFANTADNYGARAFGWFIAPSNGVYRFYVRQDDACELFMNTNRADGMDPAGKVLIAMSTAAGVNYGDMTSGQTVSAGVSLAAGQMYYMEVLLKEGTSNDGFSVAMREQGDSSVPPNSEAMPGYLFAYMGNPDLTLVFGIRSQPQSVTVTAGATAYLTVQATNSPTGSLTYQWQRLDTASGQFQDLLPGSNATAATAVFSDLFRTEGSFQYRAVVSVPGLMLTSAVATVTVTPAAGTDPAAAVLSGVSCATNGVNVTAFFSKPVTAATAGNKANYTLANHLGTVFAINSAMAQAGGQAVILSLVAPLPAGVATNYTLTASGIESADASGAGGGAYNFYVPDGKARYDVYASVTTSSVPWPFLTNAPSQTGLILTQLFATSALWTTTNGTANYMDAYAARYYGYVIPPSNGLYRFYIASDDQGEFWMNTNSADSLAPAGTTLLASAPYSGLGYVNPWWPTTVSSLVELRAGRPYYFEARHKEGGGGDYLAVAFRESADPTQPVYGAATQEKIPALYLSSPAGLAIQSMGNTTFLTTTPSPIVVAPVVAGVPATYYWYTNAGAAWVAAGNGTSLSLGNAAVAYQGMQFALVVSNAFSVASNGFTFSAGADATAPGLASLLADASGTNFIVTFTEMVDPASATNILNYTLTDGAGTPIPLAGVVLRTGGRSVVVTAAVALAPGGTYTLVVMDVADLAVPANTLDTATASCVEPVFTPGFLVAEMYTNVYGGNLAALSNDLRFQASLPSVRTALGSFDWRTTNFPFVGMSNYGVKVYGWFTPPASDTYSFYLRSDDAAVLSFNPAGPDPMGKMPLMTSASGAAYAASAPQALTFGMTYYIEALFVQGAGQEYLQVDFRRSTEPAPLAPVNGVGGWTGAYYASAEVANGSFFGVYGDPTPAGVSLAFTQEPVGGAVSLGQPVTLTAAAAGITPAFGANTPVYYQWQVDDGAGNFTNAATPLNYASEYAMRGNMAVFTTSCYYDTSVRVIAWMPGGFSATSGPVALTVTNDQFEIVSASCADGTNLWVEFSKPIDPSTGLETLNYTVTLPSGDTSYGITGTNLLAGGSSGGTLLADGRTVIFQLTGPLPLTGAFEISGTVFDIRNMYLASVPAPCTVLGATFANDIGSGPGASDPLFRGSYVAKGAGLDIKAGGSDLWNTSDGGYFVGRQVTGDFDVRVRVEGMTNKYRVFSDVWAKASLMVRADISGASGSRMMNVSCASPNMPGLPLVGSATYQFNYRDTANGSAANNGATGVPTYPNAWLRLVRRGAGFYGYRSADGVNWVLLGARDSFANGAAAYPETVLVGFAATAHNNGAAGSATEAGSSILAMYRDIYFVTPPSITTAPADAIASVNSSVVFSVAAANPAGSGALWYRWRKNGAIIQGALGPVLALNGVDMTDAGVYTVLVGNDGGAAQASASLTVNNLPPAAQPETGLTFVQGTSQNVAGLLLPNDTDPEGEALRVAAVSGVAPITWSSAFDAGLPAGTAVFGNAAVAPADGVDGSGALKLTEALGNQNGAFVITDDLAPGKSIGAFFARFKVRMGDGSGNPADGFSFNFAAGLPLGTVAAPEEGAGNGLSVNFDNYDNGGGEAPAIELKWAGQTLTRVIMPKMTSQSYADASVSVYSDGKVDVVFNGQPVFTGFQTGFAPVKNGRFGFYARTGGEYETHWIDNLSITAFTMETDSGAWVALSQSGAVQFNTDNACGSGMFYYLVSDPQGAMVLDQASFTILEAVPAAPVIAGAVDRTWYTNTVPAALPDFTRPASGVVITDNCRLAGSAQSPEAGLQIWPGSNVSVTVWAWDASGQTNTASFTYAVAAYMPPVVVSQPASLVVTQGSAFAFSVTALGDAPLTYTWYRNGVVVDGNNPAYNIASAASVDNGAYWVTVANSSGTAVTTNFVVTVMPVATAFLDFNTAGQFRSGFRAVQPAGVPDGLLEMPVGGVGGSRCLDIATGVFDVTGVYTNQPLDFHSQFQQIAVSVMVKAKAPVLADRLIQVGLVDSPASTLAATPGSGWVSARVDMTTVTDLRTALKHQNKLVAGILTNDFAASPVFTLVAGRWYKLTAVFENNVLGQIVGSPAANTYRVTAALLDYGNDGQTPGPIVFAIGPSYGTNADIVNSSAVYAAFRTGDTSGADLVDNFAVYPQGLSPVVISQPQPAAVAAGQRATFTLGVDSGSAIPGFQWYSNGFVLPGATNFFITTAPLAPAASGALFYCQVTNFFGSVYSGGAVVTVGPDASAPALASVGSVEGLKVGVRFSKAVRYAAAALAANYTVTVGGLPVTVSSALPQADGANVALTLASAIPAGSTFTVRVNNQVDYSGNAVPNGSAASGTVAGFATLDLGAPVAAGSVYSAKDGEWDVQASGSDLWGTSDQGYFVMAPRVGDFDVKVRVAAMTPPQQNAFLYPQNSPTASAYEFMKAGLNVRESLAANARDVQVITTPRDIMWQGYYVGANQAQSSARPGGGTATGFAPLQAGPGPALPNGWLRMRRVNDTFTTYTGTNGVDWLIHGQTVQSGFAASAQLGVAATLHVGNLPTVASFQFRDYGTAAYSPAPALALTADLPAAFTLVDYQTVTLTVAATIAGAPLHELMYEWQRFDAANNIWTNIPGVGAWLASYQTPPVTKFTDNGARYRCVLTASGAAPVVSGVCTLTVFDTTAPSIAQVTIPAGSTNVVLARFSEPILPDGLLNAANYVILNPAGQPVPITSMFLYGSASNTVAITMGAYLVNGNYVMIVNNLIDTSGNRIADNSAVLFTQNISATPFLVDVFLNNSTYTSVTTVTNDPRYLNNQPSASAFVSSFGFGTSGTVVNNAMLTNTGNFDNYFARVRTYFVPPTNGQYKFYIRSDDDSQLWINVNGADPAGKTLQANQTAANQNYSTAPGFSAALTLNAGQRYYVEALVREGGGGDYVTVAWRDGVAAAPANSEIAANLYFEPLSGQVSLQPSAPVALTVPESAFVAFTVSNVAGGGLMQPGVWYVNGSPVASGSPYSLAKRVGLTDTNIVFALSNNFGAAYATWNVTVVPDSQAPTLVAAAHSAPDTIMVQFSESLNPATAGDAANYTLDCASVLAAILQADGQSVALKTAPLAAGAPCTLAVGAVRDASAAGNLVASGTTAVVTPFGVSRGFVNAEHYTIGAGILGSSSGPADIALVTNSVIYSNGTPTARLALPSWNWRTTPSGTGLTQYGMRMSGWFLPPSNGVYRFWIRSDDGSQLFINTNLVTGANREGRKLMAREDSCCHAYDAGLNGSASALITMSSNQMYYMEMLMAQGAGGDFAQMVWREMSGSPAVPAVPSLDGVEVAPGDHFVQLTAAPQAVSLAWTLDLPATTNVQESLRAGVNFAVKAAPSVAGQAVFYQWQQQDLSGNWTNAMPRLAYNMYGSNYWYAPYAGASAWIVTNINTTLGNTNYVGGAISGDTAYRVIASVRGLSVTSTVCQALFVPDTEAPYIVGASGNQYFDEIILQFNEDMLQLPALGINNYSIPGLTITGVSLDSTRRYIILRTSPQTPGQTYTVTVGNLRDGSSGANLMAPAEVQVQAWVATPFFAYIEQFLNIGGATVADLTNAQNFQAGRADVKRYSSVFGVGSNPNINYTGANVDAYGTRISGFFTPPTNGYYVFFVTSDDASALYLNTAASPAASILPSGKALVAYNNGASNQYQALPPMMSTNLWLNGGQAYYIEALHKEGNGGDYVGVTFRGTIDSFTVPERPVGIAGGTPALELMGAQYLSTFADPGAASLYVTNVPPAEMSVTENDYITLSGGAYALPSTMPVAYMWQCFDQSGLVWTNVPGGGVPSLSLYVPWDSASLDPSTRQYRLGIYTVGHQTNLEVTLHVAQDVTPPYIVSAGTLDGYNVVVQMNERIRDLNANEALSWGADGWLLTPVAVRLITNVVMGVVQPRADQVLLTFDTPVGSPFTIECTDQHDWAALENVGSGYAEGIVAGLADTDIGSMGDPILPGVSWMFASNSLDMVASGSDIWGAADHFHYAFREVSGNFDIKVRVASLAQANVWSKAGLMARSSTNANARNIAMLTTPFPAQNTFQFTWRDIDAGTVSGGIYSSNMAGGGPALSPGYPNAWVRLQRSGSAFTGYCSTNGTDWTLYWSRDTATNTGGAFPATLSVGVAAVSHNNVANGNTLAQFRDLYFPAAPLITLQPEGRTVPIHQTVRFVVDAVSDPSSGPVTYQWWKDGAAVAGATGPALEIADTAVSDSAAYTVSVANDGGGSLSQPAVLVVLNQQPVVQPQVVAVTECEFDIPAGRLLQGNSDPEGDALALAAVSGVPPVTFRASFDDGLLPEGTTLYGSAIVTSTGGYSNTGCLHLTEAAASLTGGFVISNLMPGQAVSSFTARFRVRVGDASASPADGFSFNFASDVTNGVSATAEEGSGTGLSVMLDNYNSGLGGIPSVAIEGPALDVKWGGYSNLVGHVLVPAVNSPRWLDVVIDLKANGLLTVSFDGTNVFTDLPTGYVPITEGKFGFYARTGGSYATHWLDELSITVRSAQTAAGGWVALDSATGVVHYTPASGLCAPDRFYYYVTDGQADGMVMNTVDIQHAPMARADQMSALSGVPTNASLAKILANDYSYDGVAMTFQGFTQPAHGVVSVAGGEVTYTSAPGFAGIDTWTYTLQDPRGNTGTGTVSVHVASLLPRASGNVVAGPRLVDGKFWVKFAGVPGKTYNVETTTDIVNGPWTLVETVVAGRNGQFEITDALHVPAEPVRFYRTVTP